MPDNRAVFLSAAGSFVDQVARIPPGALTDPGLGDWDLRALIGHTSRSLVTVETYLDAPAAEVEVPTAAHYYLAVADLLAGDDAAVAERGRLAGVALGDDPAGFVGDLAARVAQKLAAYDDTFCLTTIAGGMVLGEYLRTRTFELVVHGLDLGRASGAAADPDRDALVDASTLAAEVAVLTGHGPELLLAVTGRAPLDPRFSVV